MSDSLEAELAGLRPQKRKHEGDSRGRPSKTAKTSASEDAPLASMRFERIRMEDHIRGCVLIRQWVLKWRTPLTLL